MQKFFLCKISNCYQLFWKKEYSVRRFLFIYLNKIILGQVCHISIPLGMLAEQKLEGKKKRKKTLFLTQKNPSFKRRILVILHQ
jgi:hypothetical protein